jgi:hypothetical protein
MIIGEDVVVHRIDSNYSFDVVKKLIKDMGKKKAVYETDLYPKYRTYREMALLNAAAQNRTNKAVEAIKEEKADVEIVISDWKAEPKKSTYLPPVEIYNHFIQIGNDIIPKEQWDEVYYNGKRVV